MLVAIALNAIVGAMNFALAIMARKRSQRLIQASVSGVCAGFLVLYVWTHVDDFRAGCWPWSPALVEYHPGMTLCPHQEVDVTFTIIIPRDEKTDDKGNGI